MEKDLRSEGFDYIECSKCLDWKWRKCIGQSPNGKRKYYKDEQERTWRGKACPECSKKAHTDYIRNRRRSQKVKDAS